MTLVFFPYRLAAPLKMLGRLALLGWLSFGLSAPVSASPALPPGIMGQLNSRTYTPRLIVPATITILVRCPKTACGGHIKVAILWGPHSTVKQYRATCLAFQVSKGEDRHPLTFYALKPAFIERIDEEAKTIAEVKPPAGCVRGSW